MTETYRAGTTGLILVDPFNDFLSEGGQNWEFVKEVALEVGVVENFKRVLEGARANGVKVFYAMHRQCEAGEFDGWKAVSGTMRRCATACSKRAVGAPKSTPT